MHGTEQMLEQYYSMEAQWKEACARVDSLEKEVQLYMRLYKQRGDALLRPCMKCGHQPLRIIAGEIEDDNGIKF